MFRQFQRSLKKKHSCLHRINQHEANALTRILTTGGGVKAFVVGFGVVVGAGVVVGSGVVVGGGVVVGAAMKEKCLKSDVRCTNFPLFTYI